MPIKVCGLTNHDDAMSAIALGAAALGFNFFRGSKRCIDLNTSAEWIAGLPPFVTRVAVVVNPSANDVEHLGALNIFDAIQLHGDEPVELVRHSAVHFPRVIKAVRGTLYDDLARVSAHDVRDILLDASVPGEYGGTGQTANWDIAARFVSKNSGARLILSGGLTPDNVATAIERVRPYAVDVASGVESLTDPRRKCADRMAAFFAAVHSARHEA